MKPARIQALVDRLLARDQCYRPIELLVASQRLDPNCRQRWETGEAPFLEDLLAGDPARSVDMLRMAAEWARKLNLDGQVEQSHSGQGRLFRNGADDRLARTIFYRRQASPQADLFLDSGFAAARGRLARSLIEADMAVAEVHLAEMAEAEPGNDLQADAEQLVGALVWLDREPDDPQAWFRRLDEDLATRARRFLGPDRAEQYLNRFWSHLAASQAPATFDPGRPELHPAALAARMNDWPAVLVAVQSVDKAEEHARLMALAATAGLKSGQREAGLEALCQLCWRHRQAAETWLELTDDQEITNRITRFWDLDQPLDIELFPAWLVSVGFPLPELDPDAVPETAPAQSLTHARRLRHNPADSTAREWLKQHTPGLFDIWLDRKA